MGTRNYQKIPAQVVLDTIVDFPHGIGNADLASEEYYFCAHISLTSAQLVMRNDDTLVACKIPLHKLSDYITNHNLVDLCLHHNITFPSRANAKQRSNILQSHATCNACIAYVTLVRHVKPQKRVRKDRLKNKPAPDLSLSQLVQQEVTPSPLYELLASRESPLCTFPPKPASAPLIERIIRSFCQGLQPANFEETGCAACGQLMLLKNALKLDLVKDYLHLLEEDGVRRRERLSDADAIECIPGPVLDPDSQFVCVSCHNYLLNNMRPPFSYANGFWLGPVPGCLTDLTFTEKLLISRVRHNRCVVRVSRSGRAKLVANVIAFDNPTVELYQKLPPSRADLSEVLAFIFLGSVRPTPEELQRTPMLVRRNKVSEALNWLKLNHTGYRDLVISSDNLREYPDAGAALVYDLVRPSASSPHDPTGDIGLSVNKESLDSGNPMEQEDTLSCPYTVHGLTGDEYQTMSMKALKARALRHLASGGKVLGIGHSEMPQSIYQNPQLYPLLFPHLFPYGVGGLDPSTLERVAVALENGTRFKPETEDEKTCFRLLSSLDYVAGKVKGSVTQKKYMQTDIWSLMSARGAPTWFITFSPADSKHPLCLYLAGSDIKYRYEVKSSSERFRLIAENPVAAARFFDILVRLFIKDILGVGSETGEGIYGLVASYYGTVEQQGRLTLHLHCLIWIKGALSPKQIREKLLAGDEQFKTDLLAYLESCCKGEFLTGTMDQVRRRVPSTTTAQSDTGIHHTMAPNHSDDASGDLTEPGPYICPTMTMPTPPPPRCNNEEGCNEPECVECSAAKQWWENCFLPKTDDLLLKSNIHRCRPSLEKLAAKSGDTSVMEKPTSDEGQPKGCLNKYGLCGARFPRDTHQESHVDPDDGHIFLVKLEAMMNTVTPTLTFVMRCNTDVTCMLSGTAIKATIGYVADYICKSTLKTYHILQTASDVFGKRNEILSGTEDRATYARKVVLKVVNALAPKMEIGSPLAALYLLGHPDHYTDAQFINFWWRSFVNHVYDTELIPPHTETDLEPDATEDDIDGSSRLDAHEETAEQGEDDDGSGEERILLMSNDNEEIIGWSAVDDYIYRPEHYENVCLIDWIRGMHKRKIRGDGSRTGSYMPFVRGHPQANSHQATFSLQRLNSLVPRYLGGSLPRRDSPDPTYYHCTMLTFFKPWRCTDDLKSTSQSWSDAFLQHGFSPGQQEMIDNYNLRYECLDSRDDYHAQMNAQIASVLRNRTGRDDGETQGAEDDMDVDPLEDFGVTFDCDHELNLTTLRQLTALERVRLLSKQTRWRMPLSQLNHLTSNSNAHDSLRPQIPEQIEVPRLSANAWREKIRAARQDILKQKAVLRPGSQDDTCDLSHVGEVDPRTGIPVRQADQVVILDASFFTRDFTFKSETDKSELTGVVSQFQLNHNQERAFRIIAQHALTPSAEQLRMYLGCERADVSMEYIPL
ncbi:hypothetical protein NP233_g8085 [Leucocoprinus birnbaumii]|uniref:Helitron helicase-like domain-containing protein n=1 Tax=Leucocoprinus birnbaumii TaxID=56174 RepID=A0AAD5VTG6_9AGAR|nr:hypothetical protein NP233_g8085 [Leucocoprinus birnbaumii]